MYLGHSFLSYKNIIRGIKKLKPNIDAIRIKLNCHPEILSEPIQCIMRKFGVENSYEIMRNISQSINYSSVNDFKSKVINEITEKKTNLHINKVEKIHSEIKDLSFDNYLGYINLLSHNIDKFFTE